jgi:hypothetical protein
MLFERLCSLIFAVLQIELHGSYNLIQTIKLFSVINIKIQVN